MKFESEGGEMIKESQKGLNLVFRKVIGKEGRATFRLARLLLVLPDSPDKKHNKKYSFYLYCTIEDIVRLN